MEKLLFRQSNDCEIINLQRKAHKRIKEVVRPKEGACKICHAIAEAICYSGIDALCLEEDFDQ